MKKSQAKFTNPKLEQIFNLEVLPEVTLSIALDDWNDLLAAYDKDPDKNFWIPGDFTFQGNPTSPIKRSPMLL
jgi:hypothetical protein